MWMWGIHTYGMSGTGTQSIFPCHFASYFLNSLFLSLLATSKLQRSPCPHPTLLYIRVACTCSRLCFYSGAKDPLTAHTLLPTEPSPHFRFLHWYQHRSVWVTVAMMPPHLLQHWYKKIPTVSTHSTQKRANLWLPGDSTPAPLEQIQTLWLTMVPVDLKFPEHLLTFALALP